MNDNKPLSKIAENHPRINKGLRYKKLAVAPGTALYEALINNNQALADMLYAEQRDAFIATYGKEFWDNY